MSEIYLHFFHKNDDTYHIDSCILSSWENGIPPSKLFVAGRRRVHPTKRIARGKIVSKMPEGREYITCKRRKVCRADGQGKD